MLQRKFPPYPEITNVDRNTGQTSPCHLRNEIAETKYPDSSASLVS
ncbi:MAG TPA: hypothetical protein VK579_00175 [Terriglobales bacterium]|nr:hypothetical protein [Terriglobales bacterium]